MLDLITSIEDVMDYVYSVVDEEKAKQIEDELKKRFNELREFIASKDYKMVYSHSMCEWTYGWWDIVLKAKDWNEQSVRDIIDQVIDFNDYISQLQKQYDLY